MYVRKTVIFEVFTDATCTDRVADPLIVRDTGDDSQDDYKRFNGSVPSDNTWYQVLNPPPSETRYEHMALTTTALIEYAFSLAAPASGTFVGVDGDGLGVELRTFSTAAASDIEATLGLWVRNNSGSTATLDVALTAA